jgi:hypothetical protein
VCACAAGAEGRRKLREAWRKVRRRQLMRTKARILLYIGGEAVMVYVGTYFVVVVVRRRQEEKIYMDTKNKACVCGWWC